MKKRKYLDHSLAESWQNLPTPSLSKGSCEKIEIIPLTPPLPPGERGNLVK